MRLSIASLLAVAAAPIAVSAAPFRRGTSDGTGAVIQFAQVLERLEATFYQEVISKFTPDDFIAAGFTTSSVPIEELTVIAFDEQSHGIALGAVLTALDLQPLTCNFDFSEVLTSVSTMITAARAIEYVGVSAFLGSLANINDAAILTSGASILTNEARHQTILNVLNGNTAIPQAFDMAMLPNEVVTIAEVFFSGPCDTGITPNTPLSVTNNGSITTDTLLEFSSPTLNSSTDTSKFSCQILVGGLDVAIVLPLDQCTIPGDINGPILIWVTSGTEPLSSNLQDRQSQSVVAGPQIAFVDSETETLGQVVRKSSIGVGNSA